MAQYPFVFAKAYEGQTRFLLTLTEDKDEVTIDGWMHPSALADPVRRWRVLRGMRDMLREETTTHPRARDILRGLSPVTCHIHFYGTEGTN